LGKGEWRESQVVLGPSLKEVCLRKRQGKGGGEFTKEKEGSQTIGCGDSPQDEVRNLEKVRRTVRHRVGEKPQKKIKKRDGKKKSKKPGDLVYEV